jgi:hypothetical protein
METRQEHVLLDASLVCACGTLTASAQFDLGNALLTPAPATASSWDGGGAGDDARAQDAALARATLNPVASLLLRQLRF